DLFLERQFDRVGDGLEPTVRADPVRPRPVLHPAEGLPLPHDHEDGQDRTDQQDDDGLEQDQPQWIVGQQLRPRHRLLLLGEEVNHRGRWGHRSPPAAIETTAPWPTPSVVRSVDPGELPGSHTTSSGRSAISTGSVTEPRSGDTVTESGSPKPAAVAFETRATTRRAVPARCGSSTNSAPSSIN